MITEIQTYALFLTAGLIGGALLGLIGVGMALVAVPMLTLTLPWFGVGPQDAPLTALATSMAIVSVGSVSSIVSHNRLGNIDWAVVRTTLPASLIGVGLGSLVASRLPGAALRWIFCAFLIVIAFRMRMPAPRRQACEAEPTTAWIYRLAGGLIGVAGSLIGAGGGVFMVPFLNARGHPMPRAVATSTTIGLPVTVVGAVIYALQPAPASDVAMIGHIVVAAFLGIGVGSVLAAPLGARLSKRVPAEMLKRGFAVVLILLAVNMALNG